MTSFSRSEVSSASSYNIKPNTLSTLQEASQFSDNNTHLFIPGAVWQQNANVNCCSNECCKRKFSFLVKRHHCRWCGYIFCNSCAPKTAQYHGVFYRRCMRCQLPVIFRSFVNPFTHERESTPFQVILEFLTPKSITALMQSCHTLLAEFPVLHYPYLESIQSRFPSFYDGAQIGKGGFGTVYKCEDRQSPRRERVAIKKILKSRNITYSMWLKTFTELSILERIHHPHVASLIEVFQTNKELVIVLEAGDGGTVRQACEYIRRHHLPNEAFVALVILHVTEALDYLYHTHHIIHRDIKLDNMVVNRDYSNVMIIDFGLANIVTQCDAQEYTAAGTAGYASPDNIIAVVAGTPTFICSGEEMLKGDVFSLGVIAHLMLTLHRPLRSTQFVDQLTELEIGISINNNYWKGISADATDLVSRMLQFRSHDRIGVEEIKVHPFIVNNVHRSAEIVQYRREMLAHEDEEEKKQWVFIEPYDNHGVFYRRALNVRHSSNEELYKQQKERKQVEEEQQNDVLHEERTVEESEPCAKEISSTLLQTKNKIEAKNDRHPSTNIHNAENNITESQNNDANDDTNLACVPEHDLRNSTSSEEFELL